MMNKVASILIFIVMLPSSIWSQDTTIQLISKIDFLPNYFMWDGHQTLLMGYTQTLSEPIGLPSPTIVVTEGDSVELKLRNMSQPPAHTIHLHGLDVDQQNDGVPHLSFIVGHQENKSYYFKAPHPGTYLYHCHVFSSLHVQAGMYGVLIVKPSSGLNETWNGGYAYNREYSWISSELDSTWHDPLTLNHTYDSSWVTYEVPDFGPQYFMVNGKSEQQLNDPDTKIEGNANEVLYLRLSNMGFYGAQYILPSELNALIVSSDGRQLPNAYSSDTINVYPGERFGVILSPTTEFTDSVEVNYVNLNKHQTENQQNIAVNIQGFLGQEESVKSNELLVYPNPTNGILNIKFNSSSEEKMEITLINAQGQIVYQTEELENEISLDTKAFQKGIYFVKIKRNNTLLHRKIVLN